MHYVPAVNSADDLNFAQQTKADGPDLVRCWVQAPPVHKLPGLAPVKILVLTSEASYHAPYDHCTSQYLTNAGVANDFVRLTDVHIHGNGHMMMLEKNNLEIAAFLDRWAREHIR